MIPDILKFFALHRQIFGICPRCGDFFRLSDCSIFLKRRPSLDWMDKINLKYERLDKVEEKLQEKEEELREKAREKGRQRAELAVKKIDLVFTPRKLSPDDAKVIFHPIDYVVFNGMKTGSMKNIVLLDRQAKQAVRQTIQKSIERVVERENYEWLTLQVQENGEIRVQ